MKFESLNIENKKVEKEDKLVEDVIEDEDVPYLAKKYLDNHLGKESMGSSKYHTEDKDGKRNKKGSGGGGGQKKGKAKKKNKPVIGVTERRKSA